MDEQKSAAAPSANPHRFSLRGLLIAFTIAALFLGALVLVVSNIDFTLGPFPRVEPRPFDQKQWQAWSKKDMDQSGDLRRALLRQDMLGDLLAAHDFSGWTTAELNNLLGPSNPDFCPAEWDIAYLLGTSWVDYVVLVFRLDQDGKVESYQEIVF
jgi:hypothetical protein